MREPPESLGLLYRAVVGFDIASARDLTCRALEEGTPPLEILGQGLTRSMEEVGRRYDQGEYFVPQLLLASDAFQAGLEVLEPLLSPREAKPQGTLVIGTVEGDIHEIGKNLVGLMFRASGWLVHDLGPSVGPARFVEACREHKPDLVGLSALMTTSLELMPGIVLAVREAFPEVGIMVGGASVNHATARRVGADGFAPNAAAAVREARRLCPGSSSSVRHP